MKKIKILLIIIPPILLTLWLYPLKEKVIFDAKQSRQQEFKIEDLFHKKPTDNLIRDVFSASLFVDWYKVSIVNNSSQIDPNCSKQEPSVLKLSFSQGDPRIYKTTLKDSKINTGFGYAESKYPNYYIKSGDHAFFIAPYWGTYSINGDGKFLLSGKCLERNNDEFDLMKLDIDYYISMKPYWVSWVAKFLILLVLWVFLLSSLLSLLTWIKKTQ